MKFCLEEKGIQNIITEIGFMDNSIKLDLILWEYSPEYRKWIKGGKK